MARARNIKPGFYKNEHLAACSLMARFIFPGLWMLADRKGRLEDRPMRIKAELLPFDGGDVDAMLNELQAAGMIVRYQVGPAKYIQVLAFEKHQTPHCKEAASTIPAPGEHSALDSTSTPPSPVQAPEKHSANTGAAPPDSLNPSSLNPESGEKDNEPTALALAAEKPADERLPSCPIDELISAYHQALPQCPQVLVRNATRDGLIRSRWREMFAKGKASDRADGIEAFREFFAHVRESKFLTGQANGRNGSPPFVADLEWLMRPTNFAKVVEGRYHRG